MLHLRSYGIGLNRNGLALFVVMLLPNLVWLMLPPSFDVFKTPTMTPGLDLLVEVLRWIMVGTQCLLLNKARTSEFKIQKFFAVTGLLLLYLVGWCFYYAGFVNPVTVLILCVSPCSAYILFALASENIFSLSASILYGAAHLLHCVLNYL